MKKSGQFKVRLLPQEEWKTIWPDSDRIHYINKYYIGPIISAFYKMLEIILKKENYFFFKFFMVMTVQGTEIIIVSFLLKWIVGQTKKNIQIRQIRLIFIRV